MRTRFLVNGVRFFVSTVVSLAFTGCNFLADSSLVEPFARKIEKLEQLNCPGGHIYSGKYRDKNGHASRPANSPFVRLAFLDEFNGPGSSFPADPASCYAASRALCKKRMDIGNFRGCDPNQVAHLGFINKCRWTFNDGYSFWGYTDKVSLSPAGISQELGADLQPTGGVVFTISRRATNGRCGGPNGEDPDDNFYGTDCPINTGQMDTEYRNSATPGWNMREGRMEVLARMSYDENNDDGAGSWPAIWLWRSSGDQPTVPHGNITPAENEYIPEIDILEITPTQASSFKFGEKKGRVHANQTYHNWYGYGAREHNAAPIHTTFVNPEAWEIYGAEREGGVLKFFIGDPDSEKGACVTKVLRDGDGNIEGPLWLRKLFNIQPHNPGLLRVNTAPEFLILGNGVQIEAAKEGSMGWRSLENTQFHVKHVRIYER